MAQAQPIRVSPETLAWAIGQIHFPAVSRVLVGEGPRTQGGPFFFLALPRLFICVLWLCTIALEDISLRDVRHMKARPRTFFFFAGNILKGIL